MTGIELIAKVRENLDESRGDEREDDYYRSIQAAWLCLVGTEREDVVPRLAESVTVLTDGNDRAERLALAGSYIADELDRLQRASPGLLERSVPKWIEGGRG